MTRLKVRDFFSPSAALLGALIGGYIIAGWRGLLFAVGAFVVGGIAGMYIAFNLVEREIQNVLEDGEEREFPLL